MDFESFKKNLKEDLDLFEREIAYLKYDSQGLASKVSKIESALREIPLNHIFKEISILKRDLVLIKESLSTQKELSISEKEDFSTDKTDIKALNGQIRGISIGNGGVQTDRQTDRQTDKRPEDTFKIALNAMDSLDSLKKEINHKFKKLTSQELSVFISIYQIEESQGYCDYKSLSSKLNLTESSIRDYVRRILLKGISVDKIKLNNKEIRLSIPSSLKRIISLKSLIELFP